MDAQNDWSRGDSSLLPWAEEGHEREDRLPPLALLLDGPSHPNLPPLRAMLSQGDLVAPFPEPATRPGALCARPPLDVPAQAPHGPSHHPQEFAGGAPHPSLAPSRPVHARTPAPSAAQQDGLRCSWQGCDVVARAPSQLQRHVRTHTGERPFKCDHQGCVKAFAQAGGLKRHKRTHTGERPYVCSHHGCEASFAEAPNLVRHERTHTASMPYACRAGCDKAFGSSSHRNRHERLHGGDTPHVCDSCGKGFAEAKSLKHHRLKAKHCSVASQ